MKKYDFHLKVDRAKWLRGERDPSGDDASPSLLDEHGNMCCMGQLARQCGIRLKAEDCVKLEDLEPRQIAKLPTAIREATADEDENSAIYSANDDSDISDARREKKLTKLLAARRVRVTFHGKTKAP